MEIVIAIFKLLAGIGLFLFAMYLLEESLKNLSGRNFKIFLQRITKNRIGVVAGGARVTRVLQSSSMVSLMVLAFVGAGVPLKPDKNPDPTKPIPGINEPERVDPTRIDNPAKDELLNVSSGLLYRRSTNIGCVKKIFTFNCSAISFCWYCYGLLGWEFIALRKCVNRVTYF